MSERSPFFVLCELYKIYHFFIFAVIDAYFLGIMIAPNEHCVLASQLLRPEAYG